MHSALVCLCLCFMYFSSYTCYHSHNTLHRVLLGKDPCIPNPCLNRGTCSHNDDDNNSDSDITIACVCKHNFKGERCEGMLFYTLKIFSHITKHRTLKRYEDYFDDGRKARLIIREEIPFVSQTFCLYCHP